MKGAIARVRVLLHSGLACFCECDLFTWLADLLSALYWRAGIGVNIRVVMPVFVAERGWYGMRLSRIGLSWETLEEQKRGLRCYGFTNYTLAESLYYRGQNTKLSCQQVIKRHLEHR